MEKRSSCLTYQFRDLLWQFFLALVYVESCPFPLQSTDYPQLSLTWQDSAITPICWEHDETPDSGITGANDPNSLMLTEIDLGAPNYSWFITFQRKRFILYHRPSLKTGILKLNIWKWMIQFQLLGEAHFCQAPYHTPAPLQTVKHSRG